PRSSPKLQVSVPSFSGLFTLRYTPQKRNIYSEYIFSDNDQGSKARDEKKERLRTIQETGKPSQSLP
ncbi:MAG: hypothetical protein K2L60_09850, partial [Bacteroides sp.]|nr:hypothetical protein [Bacteroides sp.]